MHIPDAAVLLVVSPVLAQGSPCSGEAAISIISQLINGQEGRDFTLT